MRDKMEKQTKIVERLIIISAVVISIAVISSSLLTQKHGTILVVVPIIIGAVVAMAIKYCVLACSLSSTL